MTAGLNAVLPALIASASAERDRQGALLQRAQMALQQQEGTRAQLAAFRADCLQRSAAAQRATTHTDALLQQQHFLGRLDQAIALQADQLALARQALQRQQAQMLRCQQRVLAYEALAKRAVDARNQREQRTQQRQADEFAARALRLTASFQP